MDTLLDTIVDRLQASLGLRLDAVYLFGSLATDTFQPDESAVDLLLIVADDTPPVDVYRAFHPIWRDYGRDLKHAPLFTTTSAFQDQMSLLPVLAGHLKHHAQVLYGSGARLACLPTPTREQLDAALTHRALALSPLLFQDHLPDTELATSMRQLRSLARLLTHAPAPPDATAVDLLSTVHEQMRDVGAPPPDLPPDLPPDPPVPGLVSVVLKSPRVSVFVFDALTPERLRATDWTGLAAELLPSGNRPVVTTYGHLRTFIWHETAIDHAFNRCSIQWGMDPFAGIDIPVANLLRQAGQRPCKLRLDTLPRAYLTAATYDDNALVHDFQNRVLNVHLEHEILCRLDLSTRFQPARPLPDRSLPNAARIAGIFDHLDEWVAYYAAAVQSAAR